MRDYGRIFSTFWTSPDIQALSDDGKLLAAYLLTCQHTTIIGVFRMPDSYVSEDLGPEKWPVGRVREGFAELSGNGFCNRCETTKWVWIRKFLLWNRPENPNQWKAAVRSLEQIPDRVSFRAEFSEVFARLRAGESFPGEQPSANGSGTVSESGTGTGTEVGTGNLFGPTPAAPPAEDSFDEHFARFKSAYPKRLGDQNWPGAQKHIRARLREKHTWDQIIAGAVRYGLFVEACGKTGTEFVKQASTFVGTGKGFMEPWDPPPTPTSPNTPPRRLTRYEQAMQALEE